VIPQVNLAAKLLTDFFKIFIAKNVQLCNPGAFGIQLLINHLYSAACEVYHQWL
jgi:hypothetical protein